LDSDKKNRSIVIPEQRITYQGCRARVPHQLSLEFALNEVFGSHAHARDDLPLRVIFHAKPEQELQPHPLPITLKDGITVAWLDRHMSTIAAQTDAVNFILREGSFRVGLQSWLLDWLAGDCEVRISLLNTQTKPGLTSFHDTWKIEVLCQGESVATWENMAATFRLPYLGPLE